MNKTYISKMSRVLHWGIAFLMVCMMIIGTSMEDEQAALVMFHKSMGALIFLLVVWRLVVRLYEGFPAPLDPSAMWQNRVAKWVHWALLIGTILFPLSGILMSVMGGEGLSIFGWTLFEPNLMRGRPFPLNYDMAEMASEVHESLLSVMLIALALHIAGALYHHFALKDQTLNRMLGRDR